MSEFRREPAWRVFAGELRDSAHSMVSGEGDRAPTYIITPLGALASRVYMVGAVTLVERIGDESSPMWKARLYDPTGPITMTAGQYQPEAARALSVLEVPSYAAVSGKLRVFSPEPGSFIVTMRPERIWKVDAAARDMWVAETCAATLQRIRCARTLRTAQSPTSAMLEEAGFPPALARGALEASTRYTQTDLDRYREMVRIAMRSLPGADQSPQPEAQQAPAAAPAAPAKAQAAPEASSWAPRVYALIRELDESGRGVAYDMVLETARTRGISADKVNTGAAELLDMGKVYEPMLGRLKAVA